MIEEHAAHIQAPVHGHTRVSELRVDDRVFGLSIPGGRITARRVVVVTGPFQRPRLMRGVVTNLAQAVTHTS